MGVCRQLISLSVYELSRLIHKAHYEDKFFYLSSSSCTSQFYKMSFRHAGFYLLYCYFCALLIGRSPRFCFLAQIWSSPFSLVIIWTVSSSSNIFGLILYRQWISSNSLSPACISIATLWRKMQNKSMMGMMERRGLLLTKTVFQHIPTWCQSLSGGK